MVAESAIATTPSAKLDLDMSSLDSSLININEDGGDSENVVENDYVSKEIFRLSRAHTSRKNFAANLVRKMFTVEGRASSNVKEVLGKQKLDPAKISFVQKETFRMFPLESKKNIKSAGVIVLVPLMKPTSV